MPPPTVKPIAGAWRTWLIGLGLVLATVAVYWQVGGFTATLNYDDFSIYFGQPNVRGGLTGPDIRWACTTSYYEYWHPLMWLSHMLDCQLFGLQFGWHHLVNLALHAANTLLVFAMFRGLTGMVWRSAVVAALFALHPLHVESVAWLAERKDLLSSFFALLSLWAYVKYADQFKIQNSKFKIYYWLAVVFFALGLLTKPMVVTLPFVMLLLDYWPLGRGFKFQASSSKLKTADKRETPARLVWEKLPFFGLTVFFCWTTWHSVSLGHHIKSAETVPWALRLTNIPVAYVQYLWKTVYPVDLAVLYPLPKQYDWLPVAGAVVFLLAVSWLVLVRLRRFRYLAFGWLMFLGILVPTIGIVPVGPQAFADRYMYLPSIGLFVALVWALADLVARWKVPTVAVAGAAASIILVCGIVTHAQTRHWQDSLSLWTHCLATGAESLQAHYNLGETYLDLGRPVEAIEQYRAAVRLKPDNAEANLNLGAMLAATGNPREATNYDGIAIRLMPNDARAYANLGLAYAQLGDFDGAIAESAKAVRLNPGDANTLTSMGRIFSAQGKFVESVNAFEDALRLDPSSFDAQFYLGMEYMKHGRFDEAVPALRRAVELDLTSAEARANLATALVGGGSTAEGIATYREALRLRPDWPESLNNLAWVLATVRDAKARNGAEAVKLAERACEGTGYQQTTCVGTLAAAYAEAGQFEKAVQTSQKACELASAHGEKELLEKNQALLAQFKSGQAYHE